MKLIHISGKSADFGKMDDYGKEVFKVSGGQHDGHTVTINTEKHNCGAGGEVVECSCGARWQSAMYGCWQQGHQRKEECDPTLKEMTTLKYKR